MVRLKSAFIVKCEGFTADAEGRVTEIQCSYLPESRSGADTSGISVKGTIHWVSVPHAKTADVRLYDRLFRVEDPSNEAGNFKDYINPESMVELKNIYIEPSIADAPEGSSFQFIRKGYFCTDRDSTPGHAVFNRTVTLKDAWAKEQKRTT